MIAPRLHQTSHAGRGFCRWERLERLLPPVPPEGSTNAGLAADIVGRTLDSVDSDGLGLCSDTALDSGVAKRTGQIRWEAVPAIHFHFLESEGTLNSREFNGPKAVAFLGLQFGRETHDQIELRRQFSSFRSGQG